MMKIFCYFPKPQLIIASSFMEIYVTFKFMNSASTVERYSLLCTKSKC